MAKLVEVGLKVQVPSGATGSPVIVEYPRAYYANAVAAGGHVEGQVGAVSGGTASLLNKAGNGSLMVYGGELNDPVPPLVTIRVKPRGAGVRAVDWVKTGHPRDTGDGKWDGSAIGEGDSGHTLVTEAERIGVLGARDEARAAAQSVTDRILDLSQEKAKVEKALTDTAQQQELNNAATAHNVGRKTAPSVAGIGAEAGLYNITSGAEAGQVWERPAGGGAPVRRAGLEAASAPQLAAQTQRLQIGTLAELLETEGLTAPSTVIVQQAIIGGTFAVRTGQDGDGVLSYNLPGNLTAHRLHTGGRIITAWAGVLPMDDLPVDPQPTPQEMEPWEARAQANSDAMQLCLDVARDRKIPVVFTLPGRYPWWHAVTVHEHTEVTGSADYTIYHAKYIDVGFFRNWYESGPSQKGLRFTNFTVMRQAFPTRTWEIDLLECDSPYFSNVTVDTWGHVSDRTAVSGVRVRAVSPGSNNTHLAQFHNLRCNNGSLWNENTDSKIVGGIFYGQMREYAIMARNTANVSIDGAEVISSPVSGGAYLNNSRACQITSSTRFDGSYNEIATGWAVVVEGGGGHTIGGYSYNNLYGAVKLVNTTEGSTVTMATRNVNRINDPGCTALPVDGKAYPVYDLTNSSGNMVTVGTHHIQETRDRTGGGGPGKLVIERGTSDRNIFKDGHATGSFTPLAIERAGAKSVFRDIIGPAGKDLTLAAGTITWPGAAGTQETVPHGLGAKPRRVRAYPTSLTGDATQWAVLWDETVVAIRLNAAPGTIAPTFDFEAEL